MQFLSALQKLSTQRGFSLEASKWESERNGMGKYQNFYSKWGEKGTMFIIIISDKTNTQMQRHT